MVSRVTENAGLIFASPLLIGCGCLAMIFIPIAFIVFASLGIAIIAELAKYAKEIGIILFIGGIIGVGVILFKRYGEPKEDETR